MARTVPGARFMLLDRQIGEGAMPWPTVTHTRTYPLLHPWAQTFPWDCLIRPTSCASPTHDHSPMVNQPCAVDSCHEPIRDREACYAVTELPRGDAEHEPWVCWRHVHPDEGPELYPPPEGA